MRDVLKRLAFTIRAGLIAGVLLAQTSVAEADAIQSAPTVVPSPAVAASAAPSPSTDPDFVVRATLASGLHVILLPNKLAPVATTVMTYNVGFNDDTLTGIAHATEHMLFRGTPEISAGQLADIAARMGAQYNAFTTNEYTLYYYKLPSAYLDLALHIEADRMTHAMIRAGDWATERGAIEQEIRAQESVPAYKIGLTLRESFFAGTPFATASGGTVPSFEKMTADDIRAFYHTWYQPNNATLIVAGDIDPQATLAQIHAHFDAVAGVAVPAHKTIAVPVLASTTLQNSFDYPVGFGALAYRLPGSNDADYAAAEVIAQIFSSGRTTLADLTLTGKTLAAFNVANAFPEMGADFLLGVPARGTTTEDVGKLLAGVIDGYRTTGIPVDLIEAAKLRLLSQQAYSESSISGLGFAWAEAVEEGKPAPDTLFQAVASVTADDVNRVLRTYFTPDHQISIIVSPKPTGGTPAVDPSAGVEHVGFTPTTHEALPAWAQIALKAPLRAPADNLNATMKHLPNGVSYAVRGESAAPTVLLEGFIRTNPLLYVPKGKDGLSPVVDGLLLWGTTTHDRKAYEAEVDGIAAQVLLGTGFRLEVQAKDFERGVELLAEGLLHPGFTPDSFGVVKAAELQEVAVNNGLPKSKAEYAQRLALYPLGDPRRRNATETTVASITLDDVRRYYQFAYRPDETTIAVVGDIAPERVDAVLQKYFGEWKATGPRPTFAFPKLKQQSAQARTVRVKSATNTQSEVTLKQVFHMERSDPDYVPLLLANTILSGEGTGSLLFEELRVHHGYVYTPTSSFNVDATGAEFTISFASDAAKVAPANAAIVAIIKQLQARPLPAVELQRAKALLLAQRVLPLDSYSGLADEMLAGPIAGYDTLGSSRYFWTELLATTPAQLQRAIRRIDPDHFLRVIVEPGS
jgi:zinc protease